MHTGEQGHAKHPQGARCLIRADGDAGVAGLHRLQCHCDKAHKVGPNQAQDGGSQPVACLALWPSFLQPANRQQQAHHDDDARYGIAQTNGLCT